MNLYFAGPSGHEILPDKDTLYVCGEESTRARLESAGAKTVLLDDSVPRLPEDSPVKYFCLQTAMSWYKDANGEDLTLFRGLSLGKTIEGLIWTVLFAPIYKFAHSTRTLLDAEKPSAVFAETSLPGHRRASLEHLCGQRGLEPNWIEKKAALARLDAPRLFSSGYSKWPLSENSTARRTLNRLLSLFSRPKGKRVLVSYYYTLDRVISVLGAETSIQPVFYDWAGRGLFKLARWTRWRFLEAPAGVRLSEEDSARLGEILQRWERLAASPDYAGRFTMDGISAWQPMRTALRRVIAEDFPHIAEQQLKLQAALDAAPADLVVVPYDINPPERLLLQEAHRRRIPSAIFIHGVACVKRHPFVDTGADHALIGGAALAEFFSSVGFTKDRVHDIGFPLFDAYADTSRAPSRGPLKILLFSGFLPVRENITPIVDLLRRYQGIEVTIKLHPGESVDHYRRMLGSRLDERFKLLVSSPLPALLRRSQLVIGGPSTAIVEAMALSLPVLVTNFENVATTAPFDGTCGITCHRTAASLAEALDAMLPDRVPASMNHSRTLDRFAGRIDGHSAERGLEVLLEILSRRA